MDERACRHTHERTHARAHTHTHAQARIMDELQVVGADSILIFAVTNSRM